MNDIRGATSEWPVIRRRRLIISAGQLPQKEIIGVTHERELLARKHGVTGLLLLGLQGKGNIIETLKKNKDIVVAFKGWNQCALNGSSKWACMQRVSKTPRTVADQAIHTRETARGGAQQP